MSHQLGIFYYLEVRHWNNHHARNPKSVWLIGGYLRVCPPRGPSSMSYKCGREGKQFSENLLLQTRRAGRHNNRYLEHLLRPNDTEMTWRHSVRSLSNNSLKSLVLTLMRTSLMFLLQIMFQVWGRCYFLMLP